MFVSSLCIFLAHTSIVDHHLVTRSATICSLSYKGFKGAFTHENEKEGCRSTFGIEPGETAREGKKKENF